MFKKIVFVVIIGLALTACNRAQQSANDPKSRLGSYISQSFAIKGTEDRKALLDYLTGDAKNRLSAWSDDQFRQAFIESKRQFVKLKYSDIKTVSDSEVNITYEITYLNRDQGHNSKITNKKLCNMVLDNGHWMISDVRNIKELVEYQNEMSLP